MEIQGRAPEAVGLVAETADLSELVREPQQARSRKTLARLVDATHRLLEKDGPGGVTVTGVADAAGTSVGSFYARFDGKEELIRYVGESALAEALGEWSNAVAAARREPDPDAPADGPAADLDPLVSHLLEALRQGAAGRVRSMDGMQDPAPTRLARLRGRLVSDLEALLEGTGAPADARWLAARAFVAITEAVAGDGVLDGAPGGAEDLPGEIADLLTLYLAARREGGDPEPASPGPEDPPPTPAEDSPEDPVDPFDVWG